MKVGGMVETRAAGSESPRVFQLLCDSTTQISVLQAGYACEKSSKLLGRNAWWAG